MSRWTKFFWQAMIALGEADPTLDLWRPGPAEVAVEVAVDLTDDASVRAAFQAIVEWEWGTAAGDQGSGDQGSGD